MECFMKILVVDDEKEIADLVELYLKNDGYEFVTVSELIYWDNYKIDHTGKQKSNA